MDTIVSGIGCLVVTESTPVTSEDTENSISTGEKSSTEENEVFEVIQNFLKSLKDEVIKAKAKGPENHFVNTPNYSRQVPIKLLQSLCHFIWEPNMIYASKGVLHRIYKAMNYHFIVENCSDIDDFLEYRPSELMAYKATQVFIALVLPDINLFNEEMKKFKNLIMDARISRDGRAEVAYLFLYNTFQILFDTLSDELTDVEMPIPDFLSLGLASRCVVHTLSVVFIRQFRLKGKERCDRMRQVVQDDPSSSEWCIYLAEILRLKRRETVTRRPQWASQEELDLVATAVSMDPENPFVRLTVIDTIIGCVRDANGRFKCGETQLDNLEDAMRFLQNSGQKLVTEFPRNVMFNSIISDYFARYVPMLYFDIDYSSNLLMTAYRLNPCHPKTTHRLGILYRMSLKNIDESLKWFEKTIQLDPYHFSATMEYFKTIMGKQDKYDVTLLMRQKLESIEFQGWNPMEVAEFYFYLGLAYFIKGETDTTLSWWTEVAKINEYHLTLIDLQDAFLFYEWDSGLVNSDMLRLWIKGEKDSISEKEKLNEFVDPGKKKIVNRLFAFILGRALPFRTSTLNLPFKEQFPPQFIREVAEI